MDVLRLFSMVAFAAEIIVSPLASDYDKPVRSFSQIVAPEPVVLGISYDAATQTKIIEFAAPTPTPLPTPLPTPTPTLTPTPMPKPAADTSLHMLKKNPVTIAFLGDSMTDTLGPDMPDLQTALQEYYPDIQLNVLNYGVGATNIDYGIVRITTDYEYLGTRIPSLASQHPDVVVLESFGYNPYSFDEGAIDKHWMALAQAVDTIKKMIPKAKIVIASTIAPNAAVFGDGAANLAFDYREKADRVDTIKKYLESTTRFAVSQNLPLADAYHPSLIPDGNGNLSYINAGDHIHTSPQGRTFFQGIVAKTLFESNVLE